jgi:hypothetical protein
VFPGPKDAGCAKLAPKLCNQQKHIKKKKKKKERKEKQNKSILVKYILLRPLRAPTLSQLFILL